jgi:hypothetical protein
MWTTLAVALSLLPSQAGKLELTNIRPTLGVFGTPRANSQVLPGDVFWLAFDLEGLKLTGNGNAIYSVRQELMDKTGKLVWSQDNKDQPLTADLSVGGTRLPVSIKTEVGLDTPPGEYTVKITVTDQNAKNSAVHERKFTVLPLTFGLVRVGTSYDQAGNLPAPMMGVPGQFLHVTFVTVGFERDKSKTKQPNLTVELNVLDEKNKPVLPKPESGTVNEKNNIPENIRALPMGFALFLNRPGRFTVELKAIDALTKKTATLSFPLVVQSNAPTK